MLSSSNSSYFTLFTSGILYLKLMIYSALFHDGICSMPGFYLCINSHMPLGYGAVPNVMLAFASAVKGTPILGKDLTYFLFIFCHYKSILSCRSDLMVREKGCASDEFKDKSSGIAKRVRSTRASYEPDSRTSPGISLLVAIHTAASSSHVNVMI